MDEARLEYAISELINVVREMQEKIDYLHEEVDRLKQASICERLDSVEKEFGSMVGGLNDIIDGRRKREYSEGFREKHPEFSKYEPVGKRLGLDVYGIAADSTFGLDDESAQQTIARMLEELNNKFGDLVAAMEKLEGHEAAEHGAEAMGEKPEGEGKEIEVEVALEKPDSIVEAARRFRNTRAG